MGIFLTSLFFIKIHPGQNSIKSDIIAQLPIPTASHHTLRSVSQPKKPKFDFYTILPETEVVVPQNTHTRENTPTNPNLTVTKTMTTEMIGEYILHIASYKNLSDAEEHKAKLALLGFEANIETVHLNGDTWHRVRLGPYKQLSHVESIRGNLQAKNIDSLMLKLKG